MINFNQSFDQKIWFKDEFRWQHLSHKDRCPSRNNNRNIQVVFLFYLIDNAFDYRAPYTTIEAADFMFKAGEKDKAIKIYKESTDSYKKSGNFDQAGSAYKKIAEFYENLFEYQNNDLTLIKIQKY